jgi:uncharacterized protein
MPMPHRIQLQLIKKRLVGKEGVARVRELRAVLDELPNYKNDPYADIRKWVLGELASTRGRSSVLHRDTLSIRKEGAAQVALVGPPNVGKSSLLQALSDIQIRTGDYPFTTTRPVAALTRIQGVLIQLIEIPGLIAGATEDRGGGRALLGVMRSADAIVLCCDPGAPVEAVASVVSELEFAGLPRPRLVVATRVDETPVGSVEQLAEAFTDLPMVAVSVLDDESLETFRTKVWEVLGLVRIFPRRGDDTDSEPLAFRGRIRVIEFADSIHHDLADRCIGARVWGPSARFAGQRVGRGHLLEDGDEVEILT